MKILLLTMLVFITGCSKSYDFEEVEIIKNGKTVRRLIATNNRAITLGKTTKYSGRNFENMKYNEQKMLINHFIREEKLDVIVDWMDTPPSDSFEFED